MSEEPCTYEEGALYPTTSKLLKLKGCLDKACNAVGKEVIIKTKFNTVRGLVAYVDHDRGIKVSYNAELAGYPPCYQLEQCDVISIRCYNCCDDRYFELEDCELTCESIAAALGAGLTGMTGNIYLYSGSINDPSCLYKWNGLNDIYKVENWHDQYGNLPEQLENLSLKGQLDEFLTFIAAIFSGAGISFNVNNAGDRIIVTVGDGEAVAPTSFTFSYSGGTVTLDPNDGSGAKVVNFIKRDDVVPSEPYDWFFYVNTNTNALYVNVGGEAQMLGFIDDPNPNSCADLLNCIVTNIDAGPLDPERYAMPSIIGTNIVIGTVTYGIEATQAVDFSGCTGSNPTLDDLVSNLNACDDNPAGWQWINNGGVLTLCAPTGTEILTVSWSAGGPLNVINFAGVPTVAGESGVDVTLELKNAIASRGGLVGYHAGNSEAAIELAYNSAASASIRWTDIDGKPRISYKDPINGWSHDYIMRPYVFFDEPINLLSASAFSNATYSTFGDQRLDLVSVNVPEDASYYDIRVYVRATSMAGGGYVVASAEAIVAILDIENGIHTSHAGNLAVLRNALQIPSTDDEKRTVFAAAANAFSSTGGLVVNEQYASTIRLQRRPSAPPGPDRDPAVRFALSISAGSPSPANTKASLQIQLIGYGYN